MPRAALKDLPQHLRKRIRDWQNGADGAVVFSEPAGYAALAAAAISSVWLIVLFAMSYGFRWSVAMIVVSAVATLTAGFFIVRGLVEVVSRLRNRTESSLIVTPGHILELRGGGVEYRSLDSLVTVQENHKYEDGRYQRTDITLAFDGGVSRTVQVSDLGIAEDAVEKIGLYKKRFLQAAARGDVSESDFDKEMSNLRTSNSSAGGLRGSLIPAAGGLVLAAVSMSVAVFANEYFDDVKSWDAARTADRASSYRQYLRTHPNGRWSDGAGSRLEALYGAAESRYKASLNQGHDKGAVDAVSSILRYARDTGNYQVQVNFERRAEISENMIEEIKEDFGVKKVLPLGDSFSNDKMIAREAALVGVLSEAVREVFPEDILEITQGCSANCSEAKVVYDTSFRDSIYYSDDEKGLPEEDRTYKPGILIGWTFQITIPQTSGIYEFTLESVPATTIYHDAPLHLDGSPPPTNGDISNAEKNSLYDAMVVSAFDDFRRNLVFKLGMGPEPIPQADPEADGNPQPSTFGNAAGKQPI